MSCIHSEQKLDFSVPETPQRAVHDLDHDQTTAQMQHTDLIAVSHRESVLRAIIAAAASDLELRPMVERIRTMLAAAIHCRECRVFLISEAGEAVFVPRVMHDELERQYSIDQFPVFGSVVDGLTQHHVEIQDASLPADVRELMIGEHIQSMTLVPIISQSSTVGVGMLIDPETGGFTSPELEFVRTAFQPLGLAIERFRSEQSLRLYFEQHEMLRKVSEAAMGTLERYSMADAVTGACLSFEGVHATAVAVLDDSSGDLEILSLRSHDTCWLSGKQRLPVVDWPAARTAIDGRQPLLVEDDYRYDRPDHGRLIRDQGYVRSLLIPIVEDSQVLGLVALYSRWFQAFSNTGIDVYAELGKRVLFGLQRCKLYETERVQHQLSDQLIQVIGLINSVNPDEKRILPVLAEVVREVALADAVEIVTYTRQEGEFELISYLDGESAIPPGVSRGPRASFTDNSAEDEMILTGRTVISRAAHGNQPGIVQAAVIPLIAWHDVTGAIWIWSRNREFPLERLQMVEAIGQHAGMAIERARLFAEVRWQAERDGLTGMYNHRSILSRLEHKLRSCRRDGELLAVLLFDLDNFKQLNDTFGHLAGDRILKDISTILNQWAGDSICGRYGGDEFLLIMTGATADDAERLAEQLTSRISRINMRKTDNPISIEISSGIATYPDNGSTWQALISHADQAMYEAKELDGSQVRTSGTGISMVPDLPSSDYFDDW